MEPKKSPWTLQPSYEGLLGLVDTLNAGLFVYSLSGEIVFANERSLEWTGYTADELDGQPASILVPLELQDQIEGEIDRILSGDRRARVGVICRKDGRAIPIVSCAQVQEESGEESAIVTVAMALADIQTARRIGSAPPSAMSEHLSRIGHELQMISLASGGGAEPSHGALDHPDLAVLSKREREILKELVAGERAPAIAKALFISPHTVRNHLKSMYRKLGVSNQAALIEYVREIGRD